MKKRTVYDKVKEILEESPKTRDSDKALIWEYWRKEGLTSSVDGVEMIMKGSFLKSKSTESIRRSRQRIQESYPHLKPSEQVQRYREVKEDQNGNFIFFE